MAACLAKENPDIKTFTVCFAEYEGERDEISWARELADELHIENNSKHIGEEEYWESSPACGMMSCLLTLSAVVLHFVDQEAAKKVKAVLSGEGADEFFGGYRIYQTPFANAKLSWVPKGLLRGASKAAHALGVRGANYLERASETPEDWYYTNANGVAFSPEERARLLKRPVQACSPQELIAPAYAEAAGLDDTTRMQYVDLFFWLVGDILLKTDKMSMAHSLESRVPFLDKEVFNVSRTIPTPFKANGEQTKIALREAAERTIPKDWAQKEKLGFPVPMVDWLRQDRYYNQVKEWFTGDIAQQFFNTDELVRLLDEHRYKIDRSRKIWIVYTRSFHVVQRSTSWTRPSPRNRRRTNEGSYGGPSRSLGELRRVDGHEVAVLVLEDAQTAVAAFVQVAKTRETALPRRLLFGRSHGLRLRLRLWSRLLLRLRRGGFFRLRRLDLRGRLGNGRIDGPGIDGQSERTANRRAPRLRPPDEVADRSFATRSHSARTPATWKSASLRPFHENLRPRSTEPRRSEGAVPSISPLMAGSQACPSITSIPDAITREDEGSGSRPKRVYSERLDWAMDTSSHASETRSASSTPSWS